MYSQGYDKLTPINEIINRPEFTAGMYEAAKGLPLYSDTYDLLTKNQQLTYERGRLFFYATGITEIVMPLCGVLYELLCDDGVLL